MSAGMLAFVGRERELAELRAGLAQLGTGVGGLWMFAGEPGIGKSRLAEELAREAQRAGVLTVWGRCWEAGGAPPYWPWVQVLRGVIREHADAVPRARAVHLAQLLPELDAGDAPPLSAEQARFQLLDAVAATLCDVGARRRLLIVLEDLHVADAATLALLDFLAGQVRSSAVMVLGTYRAAEAQASASGAALSRIAQQARTLALGRLSADDVAGFLAGATGAEVDDELASVVHQRTEGNPLFVVELARLFVAHGGLDAARARAVPPTIRTAIEERLAALSSPAREVLELASVMGRDFLAGQLAESFGREAAPVRRALDEAEAAALILTVGPGAYRFAHILIREALHAGLGEQSRRDLHRRLAAAMARRHGDRADTPWSEIAHHYFAAGDTGPDAIDAAVRAAQQASDAFAFGDAVAEYGHALAAIEGTGNDEARARILCGMGWAQIRDGQLAAGRQRCAEAAAIARERGDAEGVAAAALAYGSELVFAEVDPVLIDLLREALSLLPAEDSALRVRLMARLAAAQQPAFDPAGPIRDAREAIEIARRLGDRRALLDALRAGCSTMMDLENPELRLPLNREYAALAAELGDTAGALRGHQRAAIDAFELGDRLGAEHEIGRVRELAAELGHDYYAWRVAAFEAAMALWEGRFADAEAATARARELGTRAGDVNVAKLDAYQRMRLYRLTGRCAELEEVLPALVSAFRQRSAVEDLMRCLSAAQLIQVGRADEAVAAVPVDKADELMRWGDRSLVTSLAELAFARGDADFAGRILARVEGEAEHLVSSGVIGMTFDGPMHGVIALCQRTVGARERALEHYHLGIEQCRRLGGEPMVAWLCQEAAATAAEAGDVTLARARAEEAAAIAERLGMATVASRAAAVLAELDSAGAPPQPSVAAGERPGFSLDHEGDAWVVVHQGRRFQIKDSKGMRFLARLVGQPGREFHVLDLASDGGAIDAGDSGEVLDSAAVDAYRARVRTLQDELEQAEGWNDVARAEAARAEIDQLTAEISRAVGMGGRSRRAGAAAERARINVTRRVRDAIRRVAEHDRALGRHLERAVRTGTYCSYDPA